MSKFLCWHKFSNNSGRYLGVGLLDNAVTTIFSFARNGRIIFWNGCIILHSAFNESLLVHTLTSFVVVSVSDFSYSNKCIVVFHFCFNLKFPNDKWHWASFHMLSCYHTHTHTHVCFVCLFVYMFLSRNKILHWFFSTI